MPGASLTFLGGTDTVGGVQILARSALGALVFDFGVVANPGVVRDAVLFHELLIPREGNALVDYLRAGMAPLIDGLYADEHSRGSVRAATAQMRQPGHALAGRHVLNLRGLDSAVFVSHLHDDHAGLAQFVDSSTPLLMSAVSAQLHGALVGAGAAAPGATTVRGMASGEPFHLGDMVLEAIPVDHDIPGSSGILVEAPGGRFAYTGDWRAHGSHPEQMVRFAEMCRDVDVLITEASTVGHSEEVRGRQLREPDVAPWFHDVVRKTAGAVYLVVHSHNIERQEALRQVAVENGRKFVLSPASAKVWSGMAAAGSDLVHFESVFVWAPEHTEIVGPPALPTVTPRDVAANPEAWVAELPTKLRPLLLDTGAGPGDTLVHLNGHPYGTLDPGWRVLTTWARTLGLRLAVASSHGHAFTSDLRELVEAVHPGVVVPVHTNAPNRFPTVSVPVRPVRRGEVVHLLESDKAGVSA